MKLTDLSIRSVKSPAGSAQIYYDDSGPGLGIRVTKTGVKSYVLTPSARRQQKTIGRVGIVTLADARDEAKWRLAECTLGRERRRIMNWNDVRDEYLSPDKGNPPSKRNRQVKARGEAHAYTVLRALIRWAFRRHYLEKNPMDGMIAPPGSKPRKRVLRPTER